MHSNSDLLSEIRDLTNKYEIEMKIIVKHKDTKISIVETDSEVVTMRYDEQNKRVQETLKVICEQIIKMNKG